MAFKTGWKVKAYYPEYFFPDGYFPEYEGETFLPNIKKIKVGEYIDQDIEISDNLIYIINVNEDITQSITVEDSI